MWALAPMRALGAMTAVGWMPGTVCRRLVEELDGSGEGQVGIREPESSSGDLGKIGFDEDSGGLRCFGQGGVFGIGDEGEAARGGVLDAGYTGDPSSGIASERRFEVFGEFGKRDGRGFRFHGDDCRGDR